MSLHVVEPTVNTESPAGPAPKRYPVAWSFFLLASDVTMFVVSSFVAADIWLVQIQHKSNLLLEPRLLLAQVFYVCMWAFIFQRLGLYRHSLALSVKDEVYYTTAALLLGTLPQLLLFTIAPGISTSRVVIALSLPLSVLMVSGSRSLWRALYDSRVFRRRRRIAIVGKADRVAQAFAALDLPDTDSLLMVVDEIEAPEGAEFTLPTDLDKVEWFRRARNWGANRLLLTEMVAPAVMPHLLEASAKYQMHLAFAPPRIQCHSYEVSLETSGSQVLIVPSRLRACTPRARLHKRLFDIVSAFVAVVLFSPVMLIAAIAVYAESGGPILYRQMRVGRDGRLFQILKFRSMRNDAEAQSGPVWACDGDTRRTRVGAVLRRYSIDEFPQLFNVLRGDMSMVGPRPERPEFVAVFQTTMPRYSERHLVAPGITGWSQLHMRRVLRPSDAADKLHYDLQYIEHWSPFLDVSVLMQTAFEFLFHRAA